MDEQRLIELEIKLAYQDDLLQALNQTVAQQQKQTAKLEETCKLLNEKIKSLTLDLRDNGVIDEKPPHY
jgi:SlyX protein